MGNRRKRCSRRLETPPPEREVEITHVETPIAGNETLTNINTVVQESLGENESENQLTEPSQICDEIQVWTQVMEQKKNHRFERMGEEIESKFETILKEIKSNKNASTVTNPRLENSEIPNSQLSGSKANRCTGVHASNNESSDSENDDYLLRASKMRNLKHPAKPLFRRESDVDVTVHSDEETDEEEDYHIVTGANRQLHRQRSQKVNDTVGSHADHNLDSKITRR